MKLFVTKRELARSGHDYGHSAVENQLFAHAAVGARAHILRWRGAQVSTLFYGADYPGEPGYGTFFDLNNAQARRCIDLSPKPEALAFATMTRHWTAPIRLAG